MNKVWSDEAWEEAPSLGKPVLVMRDTTERPEALCIIKTKGKYI